MTKYSPRWEETTGRRRDGGAWRGEREAEAGGESRPWGQSWHFTFCRK